MFEVLAPTRKDIACEFERGFDGMTGEPVGFIVMLSLTTSAATEEFQFDQPLGVSPARNGPMNGIMRSTWPTNAVCEVAGTAEATARPQLSRHNGDVWKGR